MTEIRFYHMEQSTLDQALPLIAAKAVQSGKRVLIKAPNKKEAKHISDHLWSYRADSFLAHGMDGEDNPDRQPVYVTTGNDNPNGAKILILTHGMTSDQAGDYDLCCEMLDGRVDSQIQAARGRWTSYKDAGYALTYWQQDDKGQWHKK